MPWFHAVAERDHEIQNPTSPEKIRRLGELLRLGPQSRVLDVACGRGGPALVLAATFGCRVVGVERAPEFTAVARTRIAEAKLDAFVEVIEADAREVALEPGGFDAALCLGASFVWDGLEGTLAALGPAVMHTGYVAVGEPYWRRSPPHEIANDGYTSLSGTAERFRAAGLAVVGVIAASDDDWDAYESLHWRALEEWLAEHPDDAEAGKMRRRHEDYRDSYLEMTREHLGWAILVGWKRG